VVSVNCASAGTLFAIVNPLSWMTLPVVPVKVATCPVIELAGPTTAPSTFVYIIVQSLAVAMVPSLIQTIISPISQVYPASEPLLITL